MTNAWLNGCLAHRVDSGNYSCLLPTGHREDALRGVVLN
jgi:hypothetical protein